MKRGHILTSLALASIGFFAFQNSDNQESLVHEFTQEHLQSGGGQSGVTGAPGEVNCTLCHNGSSLDGTNENSFILFDSGLNAVSTYIPGATYTATLQLGSAPIKSGFSSTTLDASDTKAGSLNGSGIGGTQKITAGSRDYVSHTAQSNTTADWTWSWVAPATDVGEVTFYIAANVTNNNGTDAGDLIYLSSNVFNLDTGTTGIHETTNDADFTAGYNAATNKLNLNFEYLALGEMSLNLVDMNGRSVFTYKLGQSEIGSNKETITLPSELNEGMYVVHFFIGNKAMSANIVVKR